MIDGRRVPALALALALSTTAAAGLGCKPKVDATPQAQQEKVHVEAIEVRERPMPTSLALTGTLRGQRQADIAANAVGRVLQTFVERGVEVKQGDLLAKLDTRAASLSAQEAAAMAALARSQRETAKRECERYETLFAQGAIGRAELDRVSDQCRSSPLSVAAAEARASAASQMVGDGQIRAPFGGVITDRWVEAGQYVRADSRVVSMVSVDVLRLELTVPEASITRVVTGGSLTFEVPAFPGRSFGGTVRFVGAAVREATRDLVAEAEVPNPDRALRPGMFAAVSLSAGDAPAPVVPKGALLQKEGSLRVFAVVDHRLEERVVQRGVEKDGLVAVLRGLKAGDKVVAAPTEALQNGQPVE